ncbi:MAG: glucosamine-6-phosphate deaminase [Eubacteriales bacterium]
MRVIVCENYNEMSKAAARLFVAQMILKPDSVLGLATGSTPVGLYRELICRYQAGDIDFSKITTVNLDEYYPISPDNPQSYHAFMKENLFDHVNVPAENRFIPDGSAEDPERACSEYEQIIKHLGGIDLQLLGIGQNGHIGFNEPGETLFTGTHLTALTESTIEANSRFFGSTEAVPRHALTMGIATIMQARRILILANGRSKHEAVKELQSNRITTDSPATILKVHPDVILICDREAYEG